MKKEITPFKDDWNMNLGFVNHLTNLLIETDKLSDPRYGTSMDWYNALRRIYRNIMGFMEDEESTELDLQFTKSKKLFPVKRAETDMEKRVNYANDHLIRNNLDILHADIVKSMHKNNLILPVSRADPSNAVFDMDN